MQSNRSADESDEGSDEFFDAEESLPHSASRHSRKRSPKSAPFVERFEFPVAHAETSAASASSAPVAVAASAPAAHFSAPPFASTSGATRAAAAVAALQLQPAPPLPNASSLALGAVHEFVEPKTASRQRFRELRQCMQHDDDENPGNTLTPDSQNSSVEGVFPSAQRPTHPFRIIDDAVSIQSMTSLGRVGRILAGTLDAASLNADRDPSSSGGTGCPSVSSLSPAAAPSPTAVPAPLVAANVQQPTQSMAGSLVAAVATMSVDGRQQQQQQARQGSPVQKINFSEPDVIASTKLAHSKTTDSLAKSIAPASASGSPQQQQQPPPPAMPQPSSSSSSTTTAGVTITATSGPIAPPRRKKKTRKLSASSADQFQPNDSALRVTPLADSVSLKLDLNLANQRATAAIASGSHETVIASIPPALSAKPPVQPPPASPNHSDMPQPQTPPPPHNHQLSLSSPATAAIASLTREIENSFTDAAAAAAASSTSSTSSASLKHLSGVAGSMSRISHSLGNSSTSVYSKPSPSNSAKSNSAPAGRPHAIDPNQGLNLYKATRGQYVVKPQDEAANKAEGPSQEEIERVERIRAEIFSGRVAACSAVTGAAGAVGGAGRASLVGTNSLGSGMRFSTSAARLAASAAAARERRKSAGDEDVLRQLNIYVRTRTDSGKQLSDFQILEQVPVKNLDTGERIPLSVMKPPPVPAGWNPLSLHIHKLTCHLEPLLGAQKESDEESVVGIPAETPETVAGEGDEDGDSAEDGGRLRKKTARLKRFIGSTMRKTVDRAKLIASEVSHARHKEDVADIVDVVNPEQQIKIKASSTNKGPYEFTKLQHVQDLSGEHTGAVWCMKFSSCGRLLATAGQDRVLRIWVLKEAYSFFQDMRTKYNADAKSSPTPSQESLVSHNSAEDAAALALAADAASGPFMPKAFCTYTGHTSDLLDVSWSKNYFILSSSMDKTVRLWHISRRECLCCFQHIDFVTAIAFHPRDDRYFLSGSLDGKLRLWNIPDKKVALWNEVDGQTKLITAANFCQNGKFAVVGTYDGRCIFYNTDQLKYHTQIHVRSTRGRNKTGRKISGIEPMPGEDKILVTSNDSRVRLYDLRDLNLSCKYKGYANVSSQIKASFSNDGKYIVAGSENQCIYIWKTSHDYSKLSSVRRDRSDFWEGIKAHNATVTCAIFAPNPEAIIKPDPDDDNISRTSHTTTIPDPMAEQRKKSCGYVLISADFNGSIKVFINKTKPKHSSLPYTAICD